MNSFSLKNNSEHDLGSAGPRGRRVYVFQGGMDKSCLLKNWSTNEVESTLLRYQWTSATMLV